MNTASLVRSNKSTPSAGDERLFVGEYVFGIVTQLLADIRADLFFHRFLGHAACVRGGRVKQNGGVFQHFCNVTAGAT